MREKKRNLLNFFVTLFLLQLNEINSLCITTTRNPILNEAISTTLFKYNPPPSTHFLLQLGGMKDKLFKFCNFLKIFVTA